MTCIVNDMLQMASNYPTEVVSQSGDELVIRVFIRPVATVSPHRTRIDPAVSTEVNIMYNPTLDTVLKKLNHVKYGSYRLLICNCVSGSSSIWTRKCICFGTGCKGSPCSRRNPYTKQTSSWPERKRSQSKYTIVLIFVSYTCLPNDCVIYCSSKHTVIDVFVLLVCFSFREPPKPSLVKNWDLLGWAHPKLLLSSQTGGSQDQGRRLHRTDQYTMAQSVARGGLGKMRQR